MKNNNAITEYINMYERFAQLLIIPCDISEIVQAVSEEELGATERGEGGFGSTGKH